MGARGAEIVRNAISNNIRLFNLPYSDVASIFAPVEGGNWVLVLNKKPHHKTGAKCPIPGVDRFVKISPNLTRVSRFASEEQLKVAGEMFFVLSKLVEGESSYFRGFANNDALPDNSIVKPQSLKQRIQRIYRDQPEKKSLSTAVKGGIMELIEAFGIIYPNLAPALDKAKDIATVLGLWTAYEISRTQNDWQEGLKPIAFWGLENKHGTFILDQGKKRAEQVYERDCGGPNVANAILKQIADTLREMPDEAERDGYRLRRRNRLRLHYLKNAEKIRTIFALRDQIIKNHTIAKQNFGIQRAS